MKTTALCLLTKWANPCNSIFSKESRVWRRRRQASTCATTWRAELFVDGRLNSCPTNPFMIPAWCVKIAKKTQQPSPERCTTKVKFPFSGHKNADEHTIFLILHYLRPTPKAVRVKDLELTVALLPALVAKPSAQEPLYVESGAWKAIVW